MCLAEYMCLYVTGDCCFVLMNVGASRTKQKYIFVASLKIYIYVHSFILFFFFGLFIIEVYGGVLKSCLARSANLLERAGREVWV